MKYLSKSSAKYIHSSSSALKGMVGLFCGPTFAIEESRKDLEALMRR